MKIQKKVLTIIMLSISILFGLLTGKNMAVNEIDGTTSNIDNTQASQNATTQNTSRETNETQEKSSNANLSNLGIRPHDFTGFRYGTTLYEVEVPEDIETIEVYASVQHEKATLTGTGKMALERGENKAEVVVTAEDGTKKTYTINIIRRTKEEENSKETVANVENGKGLAKLEIKNLSLSPEFKTNVYEYTVKYIGEDTKLNIETKATQEEDYVVEVIGNENLREGKNFITILVSEKDGSNIATYQITVNKTLVEEEAIAREEAEKKAQQPIIIGVVIAVVVVIAIIGIIIIINRRNKKWEEEFSGDSYYEEDYEEEYEEEVPRALKGKRFQEDNMQEEEEEFEKMSKDKLKEKFLNGYTSQVDLDFDEKYQEMKNRGKHKGKRFK